MNHADSALSAFGQGLSCSQAVFSAYASEYGLDRDAAMKVSAGFGGGMGRMAQTCGAVTGAYMVIGLKYGAVSGQDQESKQMTYRLVREFAERFKAKNGSLVCKDLLGCDISTSDGFEEMKRKGLHGTVCVKVVRDACEILDEMLGREG
jgi:C_GCAxxG_C_C family probable redox protein